MESCVWLKPPNVRRKNTGMKNNKKRDEAILWHHVMQILHIQTNRFWYGGRFESQSSFELVSSPHHVRTVLKQYIKQKGETRKHSVYQRTQRNSFTNIVAAMRWSRWAVVVSLLLERFCATIDTCKLLTPSPHFYYFFFCCDRVFILLSR